MQEKLNSAHDVGGREYGGFAEFYKQTIDYETDDRENGLDLGRPEYPRVLHNNIDQFQYYTVENFKSTFQSDPEQLSIININIRGINRNFDNLVLYLNSLNYTFDAIVLTECHIEKSTLVNVDLHNKHPIEGYDKFYIESNIKYGGVIRVVITGTVE